jgi:homoserine O-succinyltransferase
MAQQYNGDPLVIGLVNNMPDGALQMTERQFRGLLDEASGDIAVRLRLFSLPELPRADAAKAHISEHYEPFSNLATGRIDGLIVTGTEPRAPTLAEEPYWKSLTNLIDWAEEHTTSTVWSCLAAHAAVFHIDGVRRQKYPEKLSGVFECAKASDHPLLANAAARWSFPHSRHNDLPEAALTAKGYQVLSRSPLAGADMFIKQRKSLFVFLQGHPEYDPGSLLREYQRDVGRFLRGERDAYPQMPHGYFDAGAAAAFTGFRTRALLQRGAELQSEFPAAGLEARLAHPWRAAALLIYTNWLTQLINSRLAPRHAANE